MVADISDIKFKEKLVFRWGSIHYQDIDTSGEYSENGRADYICRVNFAGWCTIGHWNAIGEKIDGNYKYKLTPAVYYSTVETSSHWFIIYGFYHGRDSGPTNLPGDLHENDCEGYLAVIQKPAGILKDIYPCGIYMGMITHAHWDFYSYSNVLYSKRPFQDEHPVIYNKIAELTDAHPCTFQESMGHGCFGWKDGNYSDKMIRYYPSVKPPVEPSGNSNLIDSGYELIDMFDKNNGLWPRRFTSVNEPFAANGNFAGEEFSENDAEPPWKWDALTDFAEIGGGGMAYEPAYLVWKYFSGHMPDYGFEYLLPKYFPSEFTFTTSYDEAYNNFCNKANNDCFRYNAALQIVCQLNDSNFSKVSNILSNVINYLLDLILEKCSWEIINVLISGNKHKYFYGLLCGKLKERLGKFNKEESGSLSSEAIIKSARYAYLAGKLVKNDLIDSLVNMYNVEVIRYEYVDLVCVAAEALTNYDIKDITKVLGQDRVNRLMDFIKYRRLLISNNYIREASVNLYIKWQDRNNEYIKKLLDLVGHDNYANIRLKALQSLSEQFGNMSEGEKKSFKDILEELLYSDDEDWNLKVLSVQILIKYSLFKLERFKSKYKNIWNDVEFLRNNPGDYNKIKKKYPDCPANKEQYGNLNLFATTYDSFYSAPASAVIEKTLDG